MNLSCRTQGTFATQRETVYALFQAYLRLKKTRGDYDAADRYEYLYIWSFQPQFKGCDLVRMPSFALCESMVCREQR